MSGKRWVSAARPSAASDPAPERASPAQVIEKVHRYYERFGHSVLHLADRPLRPIATPDRRPIGEVIHHGRW
jgi:hypothetical protein